MKNENNPGIRLIDANALLRQDDPTYDNDGHRVWYSFDIRRVPTYELTEDDIRPVLEKRCMTAVPNEYLYALHGHPTTRAPGTWANVGPFTFNGLTLSRFKCSICERHHFNKSNYCPNCGAQMSGGTLWQEK